MVKHVLALFAVALIGPHALACSCMGKEDVKEARKMADAVFLGTVISVEQLHVFNSRSLSSYFSIYVMRYTLQVERSFKGKSFPDTLVIVTGVGSGDCGYVFKLNERYVVYGDRDGGNKGRLFAEKPLVGRDIYWTNICTRTTGDHVSEVELLDGLK